MADTVAAAGRVGGERDGVVQVEWLSAAHRFTAQWARLPIGVGQQSPSGVLVGPVVAAVLAASAVSLVFGGMRAAAGLTGLDLSGASWVAASLVRGWHAMAPPFCLVPVLRRHRIFAAVPLTRTRPVAEGYHSIPLRSPGPGVNVGTARDQYFDEAARLSKAWQEAEDAYRAEARRYYIVERLEPGKPMQMPQAVLDDRALAELGRLRQIAEDAKAEYRALWSKKAPD